MKDNDFGKVQWQYNRYEGLDFIIQRIGKKNEEKEKEEKVLAVNFVICSA